MDDARPTDPRRQALIRALVERDLYRLLEVPPTASADEVADAIALRRLALKSDDVSPQERRVEGHWLDWAERALVRDPDLRAEYTAALRDAVLQRRASVEDRERRKTLEREVRRRRDEVARREEERAAAHAARPVTAVKGATATTAKTRSRSRRADDPAQVLRLREAREAAGAIMDADEALLELEDAADRGDAAAVTALGERVRALRDDDLPTLVAVAAMHRRVRDLDGAVSALRAATVLQPDPAADPAVWATLAAILRQKRALDDARGVAEQLVEAAPDLGHAWATLGAILADQGDPAAERALARAIELGPQRAASITRLRALRDRHAKAGDVAAAERVDALLDGLGLL